VVKEGNALVGGANISETKDSILIFIRVRYEKFLVY